MTLRRRTLAAAAVALTGLSLATDAGAAGVPAAVGFDLPASGFSVAFATAPGDLDVTFSVDGKQTTDFGGSDLASAVAVQADGKLVVAGSSDGNFALARYAVDGALDPSFSGDGLVTTDLGGTDDGQGVVIQTDGKIVVAGGSEENFALARYTTGGGLDPSFSGDGVQTTDFGLEDRATAVALQADGRIVVGGIAGDDFALARYTTGGTLDPSFSGDGIRRPTSASKPALPRWRSRPTAGSWSGGCPATISRWPGTTLPARSTHRSAAMAS